MGKLFDWMAGQRIDIYVTEATNTALWLTEEALWTQQALSFINVLHGVLNFCHSWLVMSQFILTCRSECWYYGRRLQEMGEASHDPPQGPRRQVALSISLNLMWSNQRGEPHPGGIFQCPLANMSVVYAVRWLSAAGIISQIYILKSQVISLHWVCT